MKKASYKYILGGLLSAVIGLGSISVIAEDENPIDMIDILSKGNIVYDVDGDTVELYQSDLLNLYGEINDLGIYTKNRCDVISGQIDDALEDVEDGKVLIANKMNSKGASLGTSPVPTFQMLADSVDDIYDSAYNAGYSNGYAARQTNASISYTYHHHTISGGIHSRDSSSTGGNTYSDSYTASSSGGCFTTKVQHTHGSGCYSICGGHCTGDSIPAHGGYINGVWYSGDGSGETDYVKVCSRCGHVSGRGDGNGEKTCTQRVLTCTQSTTPYYTRSCGMVSNQIVSAVITY